jgi:hypothetical protein
MVFPRQVTLSQEPQAAVTPFPGSNIPSLRYGDGFVAPLVQTGQYVLGSKGSCVHRPEIVGYKVRSDEPCLPADDFTQPVGRSNRTTCITHKALLFPAMVS